MGGFDNAMKGRKKMNLSKLRCVVVDEADFFFGDPKNLEQIQKIHKDHLSKLSGI